MPARCSAMWPSSVMRYPMDALEFGAQRKHGAEDFADRGEIVVGDPAAEAQQLIVENRRGIEHADEYFSW